MQATRSHPTVSETRGLGDFLFADVGTEANGSTLTILSVLARLDKDPWAEAARWAKLPNHKVVESLADSIAQMPLTPSALAEARQSAVRLVALLPKKTQTLGHGSIIQFDAASPNWGLITLFLAIAASVFVSAILVPRAYIEPLAQSSASSKSSQIPTASLPNISNKLDVTTEPGETAMKHSSLSK